jgi:uncharacterized protein YebE (UPF0316 family)
MKNSKPLLVTISKENNDIIISLAYSATNIKDIKLSKKLALNMCELIVNVVAKEFE